MAQTSKKRIERIRTHEVQVLGLDSKVWHVFDRGTASGMFTLYESMKSNNGADKHYRFRLVEVLNTVYLIAGTAKGEGTDD